MYGQDVNFHFQSDLTDVDFDRRVASFLVQTADHDNADTRQAPYDLIIAADGASSRVRDLLQHYDNSFKVYYPLIANVGYKTFQDLPPPPPGEEPVAGFQNHLPGEFLYSYRKDNTLGLAIRLASNGRASGMLSGERQAGRPIQPMFIYLA